ncbi:Protein IDA, partial [Cucurbita argyrosperma subsp. sororia]
MASSSSNNPVAIVVLALLLLSGFCSATRPLKPTGPEMDSGQVGLNYKTGFRYRGETFSFLPRNIPIPPSAPSDRHNSVVDSVPSN